MAFAYHVISSHPCLDGFGFFRSIIDRVTTIVYMDVTMLCRRYLGGLGPVIQPQLGALHPSPP